MFTARQIDEVSPPGTTLTLLCEPGAAAPSAAEKLLKRCRVEVVRADPTTAEALRAQHLEKVDSVLLLQPEGGGEAQDAHTLACTLALQEALRREGSMFRESAILRWSGGARHTSLDMIAWS